ncbi:hypothetical protein DWZ97_14830 [Firmicutes bacterium AF36-19BH]|nr:hypothetical protein DWZ97_14830 [Firmicutes bacterium AF36-19BH]
MEHISYQQKYTILFYCKNNFDLVFLFLDLDSFEMLKLFLWKYLYYVVFYNYFADVFSSFYALI